MALTTFSIISSVFLCLTHTQTHTLHAQPALYFSLSQCFRKCSSSPWWNLLKHSWISLICGWFKCLIISPPRSGPHQSLYSQSNLITLTTKTIKSHCQIHLASPDSTAFHWCKQPKWGFGSDVIWSGFQNSFQMGNLHCWMDETQNVYSISAHFHMPKQEDPFHVQDLLMWSWYE